MAKVNCKEIREQATMMSDAWKEGAASVEFGEIKQADFEAEIDAALAADEEIEQLEALIKLKKTARDARYKKIGSNRVLVRKGVVGNPKYGDDSPLYKAMGFVITSERASGLTRKKDEPDKEK